MKQRPRDVLPSVAAHCVLLLGALVMLLPFVWMLVTSIRPPHEIFEGSLLPWPQEFYGWGHYEAALLNVPLIRFMMNGVLICSGILIVQILVAVPAAYALAKLHFFGKDALWIGTLAALSVPIQVTALPIYIALATAGWLNTYFAIMLPFFLSVFAIFLLRQAFKTFPDEIIHAARLDGMGEFEIIWRIVLPSYQSTLTAFCIFSVVAHWNDLYWPMIVISETKLAPPPLGMMFFANAESGSDYGALMAGATLLTMPLVLIFLVTRKHFIEGLTMSGK
jgi:multiple sugar transport system permease protein